MKKNKKPRLRGGFCRHSFVESLKVALVHSHIDNVAGLKKKSMPRALTLQDKSLKSYIKLLLALENPHRLGISAICRQNLRVEFLCIIILRRKLVCLFENLQ